MESVSPLLKLRGKDILLLLLYMPSNSTSSSEGVVGMTRLTKAMFLFDKEIKKDFKVDIESFPEFIAWRFGPWSEQLPDDIEFFKGIGFIKLESLDGEEELSSAEEEELDRWGEELLDVQKSEVDDLYQSQKIFLTPTGKRFVESNLIPRLSKNQLNILSEFKKKIVTLSLFSILSYVYKKYSKTQKDWTDKSEIKDKILGV